MAHYPEFAKSKETVTEYLYKLLRDGNVDEFNRIRNQDNYNPLYLDKVNLEYTNLAKVNFRATTLNNANLRYSDLSQAIFNNTSLRQADLDYAKLIGMNISNTDFQQANMKYAELIGMNISNTDFKGADLSHSELIGVDFSEITTFIGANLQFTKILGSHFEGTTTFIGANLQFTKIFRSHFSGIVTFINQSLKDLEINGISESTAMLNFQSSKQLSDVNIRIYEQPSINEYMESIRQFSNILNKEVKGLMLSPDQLTLLNEKINNLAEEIKIFKDTPELGYITKVTIESKLGNVIKETLTLLPDSAENISMFKPLNPFSKLIGKGISQIVNEVDNYLKNKKQRNNINTQME